MNGVPFQSTTETLMGFGEGAENLGSKESGMIEYWEPESIRKRVFSDELEQLTGTVKTREARFP